MLLDRLREYVRAFGITDILFPGYRGRPLTVRNVQDRIKRYARAAGFAEASQKRLTPHCLRHSVAVHYLQGGAPLSVLQSLLGHCHMGTTGRYLQLTDQMAKQIALSTETGLERLLGLPGKDQSTSEARVSYAAGGGLALWDEYMSVVGAWLGM